MFAEYEVLFFLYFINAILLITHEIDSAYWKEWELFKMPGGVTLFLILHFPILFIVLLGLVLVYSHSFEGIIFSLILSLSGIFAFSIHTYFIKKGHQEFRSAISQFILAATLIISIFQGALSVYLLVS